MVLLQPEWRPSRSDKVVTTIRQKASRQRKNLDMDVLFPESPHFLEQLKHLNSATQDDVVRAFLSLAKADTKQGHVVDVQSGLHEVLSIILERVAFFPMKPSVMEVRKTVS